MRLHSDFLLRNKADCKEGLMSEQKTNAMRLLDSKKAGYKVYDYTKFPTTNGGEVAAVLGQNPDRVFKTLVTVGKSGKNYVFMLPVNAELDLKKAAAAAREKSVSMLKSRELLPLTGYVHGGCSPIGMKKLFKTFIHSSAQNFDSIIFSGGRIGWQIETSLDEIQKLAPFVLADIV